MPFPSFFARFQQLNQKIRNINEMMMHNFWIISVLIAFNIRAERHSSIGSPPIPSSGGGGGNTFWMLNFNLGMSDVGGDGDGAFIALIVIAVLFFGWLGFIIFCFLAQLAFRIVQSVVTIPYNGVRILQVEKKYYKLPNPKYLERVEKKSRHKRSFGAKLTDFFMG